MAAKIKATMSTLVAVLITQIEVNAKKTDRLFNSVIQTCADNSSANRVEPCICMATGFDSL